MKQASPPSSTVEGTAEKPAASRSASTTPRSRGKRVLRIALLTVAIVGFATLAFQIARMASRRAAAPKPPVVQHSGDDPEVTAAIDEARQIVLESPYLGVAWGRLGIILHVHTHPREAAICLDQAERLDPNTPLWPYFNALAVSQSDPELMIEKLRRTVTLYRTPDGQDVHPAPRLRLAEALFERGQVDEAESHFRQCLTVQPDNVRATIGLARVVFQRGDLATAVKLLRSALATEPDVKAARTLLGTIYGRMGQVDLARAELRRADALIDKPWPDELAAEANSMRRGFENSMAYIDQLINRALHQEAMTRLQDLVKRYPDKARAWVRLGTEYQMLDRLEESEQAIRRGLDLDPSAPEGYLLLGYTLLRQRRFAEAEPLLRKAIELQPASGNAYFCLGMSRRGQGDVEGAVSSYTEAVRLMPDFGLAYVGLGETLARLGRFDEAKAAIEQALRLDPADPSAQALRRSLATRPTTAAGATAGPATSPVEINSALNAAPTLPPRR